MMTDVEGIYQDFADKDSLISEMTIKTPASLSPTASSSAA